MTDFVKVAGENEIAPGERIVVQIGRKWVIVFNVGGQFYAIEDQCTHDGGELADGALDGHEIRCTRHGAKFDVRSGAVTKAPALTPISAYDVRVEDGQVMVATTKRKKA